jgi:hypothetical protein
MEERTNEIMDMVNRETEAWDRQDAEMLVSIFHPDMVWPWPPDNKAHDPIKWVFVMGRYDRRRWQESWQELFDTHKLIHNNRTIQKIEISADGGGAMAVVDVDTIWENRATGIRDHWKGRACKIYSLVDGSWKMTAHTGLLEYNIDD